MTEAMNNLLEVNLTQSGARLDDCFSRLMIYHVIQARRSDRRRERGAEYEHATASCIVIRSAGRGLDREVAPQRAADGHRLFETVLSMAEVTTVSHARPTTRPNLDQLKTMWPSRAYRITSAGSAASNKQPQPDGRVIPR